MIGITGTEINLILATWALVVAAIVGWIVSARIAARNQQRQFKQQFEAQIAEFRFNVRNNARLHICSAIQIYQDWLIDLSNWTTRTSAPLSMIGDPEFLPPIAKRSLNELLFRDLRKAHEWTWLLEDQITYFPEISACLDDLMGWKAGLDDACLTLWFVCKEQGLLDPPAEGTQAYIGSFREDPSESKTLAAFGHAGYHCDIMKDLMYDLRKYLQNACNTDFGMPQFQFPDEENCARAAFIRDKESATLKISLPDWLKDEVSKR